MIKIETLQTIAQVYTVATLGGLGVAVLTENFKEVRRNGSNNKRNNNIRNVHGGANRGQCMDDKKNNIQSEKKVKSYFIDLTPYEVKK